MSQVTKISSEDEPSQLITRQPLLGWRLILFLPFKLVWQVIFNTANYFIFLFTIYRVFYNDHFELFFYAAFLCDSIFTADVICATMHYFMYNVRKLTPLKHRSWYCLLVDYISLFPIELVLNTLLINNATTSSVSVLYINRCLRIYHVFIFFYNVRFVLHRFQLTIMVFGAFVGMVLVSHLFTGLWFYYAHPSVKAQCVGKSFECLVDHWNRIFSLITHNFQGDKDEIVRTRFNRVVVTVAMLWGYFLKYGILMPFTIFTYLKSYHAFFDYAAKYDRLKLSLNNMLESKYYREVTHRSFEITWARGTDMRTPEMLSQVPLSMQKSLFTDIHWDLMRHSEYLCDFSLPCKRALSLLMETRYVMEGAIVMDIGKQHSYMLYLASGRLELMAEENEDSVFMVFSPGTLLGEECLMMQSGSKAKVRAATYVEIHILRITDLFRCLLDYPSEMRMLRNMRQLRMKLAKSAYHLKTKVCKDIFKDDDELLFRDELPDMKLLKEQYRGIAELHRKHILTVKALQEGVRPPKMVLQHQVQPRLEHISNNLEKLASVDSVVEHRDLVFLKTTFPWIINPHANFLSLWNNLVLITMFLVCTMYPYHIAWYPRLPKWFVHCSIFAYLINIIDIFLQMTTAVETKDLVITHVVDICLIKLESTYFYVDMIAAVPLYWTVTETQRDFEEGFYLLPVLLKVYRIFRFFNSWTLRVCSNSRFVCNLKNSFTLLLAFYWATCFLQLTAVECVIYDCISGDWYEKYKNSTSLDSWQVVMLCAAASCFDIPSENFVTKGFFSGFIVTTIALLCTLVIALWFGESIAIYLYETSSKHVFRSYYLRISQYLTEIGCSSNAKKRILNMMQLQWDHDHGDYILQEARMINEIPTYLRKTIVQQCYFKTLKNCSLFELEEDAMLDELCQYTKLIALPKGSIVVTFGCLSHRLHIVHKGYLQVNSFLKKDARGGSASPILYGVSKCIPVYSGLRQTPSVVSATCVTDCELIELDLEHIFRIFKNFKVIEDLLATFREIDSSQVDDVSLTFTNMDYLNKKDEKLVKEQYHQGFNQLSHFGPILKALLLKKGIDMHHKGYHAWEAIIVLCLYISLAGWPLYFGLFSNMHRPDMFYCLLFVDSILFIDLYIRLHVCYYTDDGVLVSHPLYTSRRYLSGSFIIDFTCVSPFIDLFLYTSTRPTELWPVQMQLIFVHLYYRMLAIYRIYGFFTYFQNNSGSELSWQMAKYSLIGAQLISEFINLSFHYSRPHTDSPFADYLLHIHHVVVLLFRNEHLNYLAEENFYSVITLCYLGVILEIMALGLYTSKGVSGSMAFSVFLEHINVFNDYVTKHRLDDKIRTEALLHYQHQWEKLKNRSLDSIFERFPPVLHEDITYPIYSRTLRGVACMSTADESFYRMLSRNVTQHSFRKGSQLTFPQAVLKEIFFLHMGDGFVTEMGLVLPPGSMVGDIHGTGIVVNSILALTHVIVLSIPSATFFSLLNNFFETESTFKFETRNVEDFVVSGYEQTQESKEALSRVEYDLEAETDPNIMKPKAEFVPDRPVNNTAEVNDVDKDYKKNSIKIIIDIISKTCKFYPNSRTISITKVVFLMVAYTTVIFIPLLHALHVFSISSYIFLYTLDFIWIAKLIINVRTSYRDSTTGDLVTEDLAVCKYRGSKGVFFIDVLSSLPLEVLAIIFAPQELSLVSYLRLNRLLRSVYAWKFHKMIAEKLNIPWRSRWLTQLMSQILMFHSCAVFYILIAKDPKILVTRSIEFGESEKDAIIWSYCHVANVFCGAGVALLKPVSIADRVFIVGVAIGSLLSKGMLVNATLSMLNTAFHTKIEFEHKMTRFIQFLKAQDSSPAMVERMQLMGVNIMHFRRAHAMPLFLEICPYPLKVKIMADLYLEHLLDSPIFAGLSIDFLRQLAARFKHQGFFPKNDIVKKGDIDNTMYFIHRGEVMVIDHNPRHIIIEWILNVLDQGQGFGLMQGLCRGLPHYYSYRAQTKADILQLRTQDWQDLRLAFPKEAAIIAKRVAGDFHHHSFDNVPRA